MKDLFEFPELLLQFGLEILDEEGYSFDCHWFENDEKRQKFIIENNIQTN
jgi:hypothetical protein